MELWIRSQKGRLCQIIDISEPILDEWENIEGYCLYGRNLADTFIPLAMYKTKERALEVLDEIQNILIGKFAVSLNYKDAFSKGFSKEEAQKILEQMVVYQMPKE